MQPITLICTIISIIVIAKSRRNDFVVEGFEFHLRRVGFVGVLIHHFHIISTRCIDIAIPCSIFEIGNDMLDEILQFGIVDNPDIVETRQEFLFDIAQTIDVLFGDDGNRLERFDDEFILIGECLYKHADDLIDAEAEEQTDFDGV